MKKDINKENRLIDEDELDKVSGGVAIDSNPNGLSAFNNVAPFNIKYSFIYLDNLSDSVI